MEKEKAVARKPVVVSAAEVFLTVILGLGVLTAFMGFLWLLDDFVQHLRVVR